jgi:methylmalonyl-CoA/ethylmalonyl-CoA epimerase
MLTHIDHVGIACRDLEEKISFYCTTFGLTVASREVNEEQGVREAMLLVATAAPVAVGVPDLRAAEARAGAGASGTDLRAAAGTGAGGPGTDLRAAAAGTAILPLVSSYVQLLEPLRPDSPVGKFLERRGEGIHHIGYGVADVRAALAAIGASGVRLVDERPRHGSMGASIAFLHPADVGGVLTELVEHPEDH